MPVLNSLLFLYDFILQVVTLAVYFYFLASLFGAQWVMPATEEVQMTFLFKPALRPFF
jgi:hypothetical protein